MYAPSHILSKHIIDHEIENNMFLKKNRIYIT